MKLTINNHMVVGAVSAAHMVLSSVGAYEESSGNCLYTMSQSTL